MTKTYSNTQCTMPTRDSKCPNSLGTNRFYCPWHAAMHDAFFRVIKDYCLAHNQKYWKGLSTSIFRSDAIVREGATWKWDAMTAPEPKTYGKQLALDWIRRNDGAQPETRLSVSGATKLPVAAKGPEFHAFVRYVVKALEHLLEKQEIQDKLNTSYAEADAELERMVSALVDWATDPTNRPISDFAEVRELSVVDTTPEQGDWIDFIERVWSEPIR